jgi:heterodisulfide reductase subunit C
MSKFGFSIKESRSIDYNKFDDRLLNYVLMREPTFLICISCGACTATCSAGNIIDFNIRRLSLHIRRGELAQLSDEIDKCMLCGKCQLICPRGVNTRNAVLLMKKGISNLKLDKLPKHNKLISKIQEAF